MLDTSKEVVQDNAVEHWVKNNKVGVIEAVTGIGKTFIFLKALHTCDDVKEVLFLAEQIDRKYDLLKDIKKFDTLYNKDTLNKYHIKFMTYQSAYKIEGEEFEFVCADEIHDSLTPVYSNFYIKNRFKYFIGLSATLNIKTEYENEFGIWTKKDLLKMLNIPIVFKYRLKDGQKDGTLRPLNIIIYELKLNDKVRNIKITSGGKVFYTTEKDNYEYWEKEFNNSIFIQNQSRKDFMIRRAAIQRAKILYTLPTKVDITKEILKVLNNRTLVFSNDLNTLKKITPNVVSSHNSEDKNNYIRKMFEEGKINIIGSFKKLKQGANLIGLDNIIIMSYYSTNKDLIQRIGRLRKEGEKVGNVIILLTKNTKEEFWLKKMFENVNLNIKRVSTIDELKKHLVYEGEI